MVSSEGRKEASRYCIASLIIPHSKAPCSQAPQPRMVCHGVRARYAAASARGPDRERDTEPKLGTVWDCRPVLMVLVNFLRRRGLAVGGCIGCTVFGTLLKVVMLKFPLQAAAVGGGGGGCCCKPSLAAARTTKAIASLRHDTLQVQTIRRNETLCN
jgi:hypothetical protein